MGDNRQQILIKVTESIGRSLDDDDIEDIDAFLAGLRGRDFDTMTKK